jgi:hypothetical protein
VSAGSRAVRGIVGAGSHAVSIGSRVVRVIVSAGSRIVSIGLYSEGYSEGEIVNRSSYI